MKYKQAGNCPICDSERGIQTPWGMSPEGWVGLRDRHEAEHPENVTKPISEKTESKDWYNECICSDETHRTTCGYPCPVHGWEIDFEKCCPPQKYQDSREGGFITADYFVIKDYIRKLLATQKKLDKEELVGKVKKLLTNSEARTSALECSQEGYEYGVQDVLDQVLSLLGGKV